MDAKGYIYAATSDGLAFSSDGGVNYTTVNKLNDGLPNDDITSVYVDDNTIGDNTDDVLYVGTVDGLAISTDNGVSFNIRQTMHGLGDNEVHDIIVNSAKGMK